MRRLQEEEISLELESLSYWKRVDEKWISSRYRFKDFLTGISFVNKVAHYAENNNHHPFISIDYKVVTLKLSSWRAKGLTDLDFEMAKQINHIYETME